MWIESGFRIEDDLLLACSIDFLPNNVFLKFDDELEKAARRITNSNKHTRPDIGFCDDELFLYIFPADNEKPILKRPNDKMVPFEKLVNVDSFGRCKIVFEGLHVSDYYMEPIKR